MIKKFFILSVIFLSCFTVYGDVEEILKGLFGEGELEIIIESLESSEEIIDSLNRDLSFETIQTPLEIMLFYKDLVGEFQFYVDKKILGTHKLIEIVKKAQEGRVEALNFLGMVSMINFKYEHALYFYKEAFKRDPYNSDTMWSLGKVYEEGFNNHHASLGWYESSAEQGSLESMCKLASMLLIIRGSKNEKVAQKWIIRTKNQGYECELPILKNRV